MRVLITGITGYIGSNLARAFRMAAEQLLQREDWKNETFQICAGTPLTLRKTVTLMLKLNGLPPETVIWGQRPNADREIRKAIRLYPAPPGWKPRVSIETGLICLT